MDFRFLCLPTVVNAFTSGYLKSKLEKGTRKEESAAQSLAKAGSSRNQDEGGPKFDTYKGRDVTAQPPKAFEVNKEFLSEISCLNSLITTDEMFEALGDIVQSVLEKQIDIIEAAKNIRSLRIQSKIKECLLYMAEDAFKDYRRVGYQSPEQKMIVSLSDIQQQFQKSGADSDTQCVVPHYDDETGDTSVTLCLIIFIRPL